MKQTDIYTMVTERIISKLQQGCVPWNRGYSSQAPQNFVSKREYSGINYWLTVANGYTSPFYLTYKQARDLGGCVKAGEKGTPIVFWQILEKESKNADGVVERKKVPLLKYFTVFNAAQISGIEFPQVQKQLPQVKELDELVANMKSRPMIKEASGYTPCYVPATDLIRMPLKDSFHSSGRYYKTLIHELAHSTGAANRLNRDGVAKFDRFGSHKYSLEELIAELTACFVLSSNGLEDEDSTNQSAAYIGSWIKALQNDHKFIFSAAKHAQLAVKYIRNEIEGELGNKVAA